MSRKETISAAAARIIAGRVFGPFREAGGLPGEFSIWRYDGAAGVYLWNRRVRGMGATQAMELAAPWALRPHTERAPQWYGPRGPVGRAFRDGSDTLRHFSSTRDAGLRFVGWSDELNRGIRHRGWFCDDDERETLRGGVWQLPGRDGRARLVYGYAEFESRDELNPGSAVIVVSHVLETERADDMRDSEELRDAARYGDGMAESAADARRDYERAYQAGREAGEHDEAAIAARKEALPLLRELKAAYRVPMARVAFAGACAVLRDRIDSLIRDRAEARAARDAAWDGVFGSDVEPWKAGFIDSAGFLRAVRLGYARASDWHGPADRNPCNAGAGA